MKQGGFPPPVRSAQRKANIMSTLLALQENNKHLLETLKEIRDLGAGSIQSCAKECAKIAQEAIDEREKYRE